MIARRRFPPPSPWPDPDEDEAALVELKAAELCAAAEAVGFRVIAGAVVEKDLAHLLKYSYGGFAQMRREGRGPPRIPCGIGGQISYLLTDVAKWWVRQRWEETD